MDGTFPLVFSVTSGKGGGGQKTNLSVNLALFTGFERQTCCAGRCRSWAGQCRCSSWPYAQKKIFSICFMKVHHCVTSLYPTPYGFSILPASSGISDMLILSTGQKLELLESVGELEDELDYLIVDTGAGINDNVLYFNLAAQERLVVLTPEPTSLTDAYALIKVLKLKHGVEHFKVCVNMAPDQKNGKRYVLPARIRPATGFEWGFPWSGWSNSPETTMYVRVLSIKTLLCSRSTEPGIESRGSACAIHNKPGSATRYWRQYKIFLEETSFQIGVLYWIGAR